MGVEGKAKLEQGKVVEMAVDVEVGAGASAASVEMAVGVWAA